MSQATEETAGLKIRIVQGSSLNRAAASGCPSVALTFNQGRTQGTTDARGSCFHIGFPTPAAHVCGRNPGATRGSVLQKVYLSSIASQTLAP